MITVSMFTHSNDESEIIFEESDLLIVSITDGEAVSVRDFELILECILDIETKYLKPDEWYYFDLKRSWDDDVSGRKCICYFECIKTQLIP